MQLLCSQARVPQQSRVSPESHWSLVHREFGNSGLTSVKESSLLTKQISQGKGEPGGQKVSAIACYTPFIWAACRRCYLHFGGSSQAH